MTILAWITIAIAIIQATAIIQVKPTSKSEKVSKVLAISHSVLAIIMAVKVLVI